LAGHPAFRLLLTAEVAPLQTTAAAAGSAPVPLSVPVVPIAILRGAVKLMFETPTGAQASLGRLLTTLHASQFAMAAASESAAATGSGVDLTRPILLLAWLHTVILERRRYVPVGWRKGYDFSDADFESALTMLTALVGLHAAGGAGVASAVMNVLPALQAIMHTALYGGRCEDGGDAATLREIAARVVAVPALGGGHPMALQAAGDATAAGSGSLLTPDVTVRGKAALLEWVEARVPVSCPPTWLGLPADADVMLARATGAAALRQWVQLQSSNVTIA